MKSIKTPQNKLDWEQFRTCHRSDTLALVKSLEGSNISEEEFTKKYSALPKPNRAPAKGRHLYKYLVKMNYFKNDNS